MDHFIIRLQKPKSHNLQGFDRTFSSGFIFDVIALWLSLSDWYEFHCKDWNSHILSQRTIQSVQEDIHPPKKKNAVYNYIILVVIVKLNIKKYILF